MPETLGSRTGMRTSWLCLLLLPGCARPSGTRELRVEGLPDRGVYRPGEVCRLLRISPTTLRQFCELAEHPTVPLRDPRALESFLVGYHHRISHAALVDWLARNQKYQRDG